MAEEEEEGVTEEGKVDEGALKRASQHGVKLNSHTYARLTLPEMAIPDPHARVNA